MDASRRRLGSGLTVDVPVSRQTQEPVFHLLFPGRRLGVIEPDVTPPLVAAQIRHSLHEQSHVSTSAR